VAFLAGEPQLAADIRARVLEALHANATGHATTADAAAAEVSA